MGKGTWTMPASGSVTRKRRSVARKSRGVRAALTTAVLLSLIATAAPAQTPVTGNILQNTTWTVGGSPYIIEKTTVEVRFGSTLAIDPGVEVRFQSGTKIETDASGSSVVAVGTVGDSIRFTSDSGSPSMGDWYGVHVFLSPASEFRHCVFDYAEYGLYVHECESAVERCRFQECVYGVHARGSGDATIIERCVFRECDIGVWADMASPKILECWITDSGIRGIWSTSNTSEPYIWHCNLENDINVRLDGYTVPTTIVAIFNWWGSIHDEYIHPTIVDSNDLLHGGKGVVAYEPWLLQVPVEVTSWGRIKALFR